MCKAPVSAILGLPLEWHIEKAPVSPRHAEQQQLQPWSSRALSQGSCSGETSSALTFWELKPRSSGTHSHNFSFNTIHCPCHFRSTAKCPVLQPFWDPHCQVSAGARQGSSVGMRGEHSSCTKQTRTCHCTATNDKGNLREFKAC